jgi:hypothetical protein
MSRKFTKEDLEHAVSVSFSYAQVARHLGVRPSGGSQAHLKKKIQDYRISTEHFTSKAWSKGKHLTNRYKLKEDILIVSPEGSNRQKCKLLKRAMLESGMKENCSICYIKEWNNTPLKLEIDHIDGNYLNNTLSNLRFICPNCHSQTTTYKNKKR